MIDTIHFRFDLDCNEANKLQKIGTRTTKVDYEKKVINYDLSSKWLKINWLNRDDDKFYESWSYQINVKTIQLSPDYHRVDIEFSVPKMLYGHNVKEITTIEDLYSAMEKLYQELSYHITPPPYKKWEITRLDLCKVMKYTTQIEAENVLNGLQTLNYLNFKKHRYKTAVMWSGEQYSLKYYLKLPEYMKHDYKRLTGGFLTQILPSGSANPLHNEILEYAEKIRMEAEGLLRFEITMRSGLLKRYFGDKMTIESITLEKIDSLLGNYITKLNKIQPTMMGLFEIQEKLFEKYGKTRGVQLYQFYITYFDTDVGKLILQKGLSRSQINKNIKLLKEAQIGISENLSLLPDTNEDAEAQVGGDDFLHQKTSSI